MKSNVIYEANVELDNEPRTIVAFDRLRPKYAAIPAADLLPVNARVTTVVAIMAAAARRMAGLRDELGRVAGFDPSLLDELPLCADGLDYVEGEYRAEQQPAELAELAQEARQTREMFVRDLRNLVAHGRVGGSILDEYTGAPGFKNLIDDVRLLARVYRNHWPDLTGKTCRTLDQLDRAEAVIRRMAHRVGDRELGEAAPSPWADLRARAFTYAVHRYDEARRGIAFVRWAEGDADKIAPSLWSKRGRGRKGATNGTEDDRAEQPGQPGQPRQSQPVSGSGGTP